MQHTLWTLAALSLFAILSVSPLDRLFDVDPELRTEVVTSQVEPGRQQGGARIYFSLRVKAGPLNLVLCVPTPFITPDADTI